MADDVLTKVVVDCGTNTTSIIPLTLDEIAEQQAQAAAYAAEQAIVAQEQAAKEALKASAIAKLVAGTPLTEAEAALIIL